jgi:hypothetical protein
VLVVVVFVATAAFDAPSSPANAAQSSQAQSSQFPQYSVEVLQLPAKYTQGGGAVALNDNGDVVGLGDYYTGNPVYTTYDALLWKNGVASDISSQVHGGIPVAIGNNDDVLGTCSDAQIDAHTCNTFVADLDADTYQTTDLAGAYGMNPQGTVAVGTVSNGNLAGEWQGGVTSTIPDSDFLSMAFAVNTQGIVVGTRETPTDTTPSPEEWTSDGGQAISGLCSEGQALAINDAGDVAGEGQGYSCPQYTYSFLNHDGQTIDLGVLPGFAASEPIGMDGGMVVGNDLEAYGSGEEPYVYVGHQLEPLQNLLANGTDWQLTQAIAVNRVGQILAYGVNSGGVGTSLLLTPKASYAQPPLPTLSSISISPVPSHVDSGSDFQLQATADWSDGSTSTLDSQIVWSSPDLQLLNGGAFEAWSPGLATATVTDGSVTASVNIDVVGPTSISLNPKDPTVAANGEQQFTATGTFPDGTTSDITPVSTWSSSNSSIASANNPQGSFRTFGSAGSTTITVSDGGASASTTLTVTSGSAPPTTTTTTTPTSTTTTSTTTTSTTTTSTTTTSTTTTSTTTPTTTPPSAATTPPSPSTYQPKPVTSPTTTASHGYWLVGSDGGIFTFGSAQFHGSTGSLPLQRPMVGIVPTTDDGGYWLDASDGGVFAFGDSRYYGSVPGLGLHPAGSGQPNSLDAPIVGMVPSADGGGYFMVASDGGVFAFGDARFAGSCPGIGGCSGAAVAVMPDASGNGYWLVTQTGHVYAFGDAPYYGAPGNQRSTVTSAVRTPDGRGYWILFADGSVDAYGDAGVFGAPEGKFGGTNPATAITSTADGQGYWVASADGTVDTFGDAPNDGSMAGTTLNDGVIAATGW